MPVPVPPGGRGPGEYLDAQRVQGGLEGAGRGQHGDLGRQAGGLCVGVCGAAGADGLQRLGEVVVVGAHGPHDAEHCLVAAPGGLQSGLALLAVLVAGIGEQGRDDDGGGVGVAVAAQRPADGLDDVGDRFLRVAEQHRVDRGDVDALPEAAGVGHDRPAAGRRGAQRLQRQVALKAGHPAVDVPGGQRPGRAAARREHRQRGGKAAGEPAGLGDAGQERDAAAQPELGGGHRERGLGGGHPDRHVPVPGQLAVAAEQLGDLAAGNRRDHDPVVLQPPVGDRAAERVAVGDRAEERLVVHRDRLKRPVR